MGAAQSETVSRLLPGAADAGLSWWQAAGACLVVFGLLLLCLKVLGRFGRSRRGRTTGVLELHPVGHRRDIQVLRFGDEVYSIYRQDASMVLLRSQSYEEWRSEQPQTQQRPFDETAAKSGWEIARNFVAANPLSRRCLRNIF